MLLSLALRNLLRNRRRSLMTLSAMVVGLVSLLIFGGYARNGVLGTQTGYVQYHGHLQIQRKGYFLYGGGNPVAYGIADYQKVIEVVKNDPVLKPMLKVVTPTLRLNGIVGNFSTGVSRGVVAAGVVPEDQKQMRKWNDYDTLRYTPPIPLEGTPHDSTVIGTGVARMLQLCAQFKLEDCPLPDDGVPTDVGNQPAMPDSIAALSALEQIDTPRSGSTGTGVELLAASARGAPNVTSLNVVKVENWGVKEIDDSLIVMHLDQAQRLVYGAEKPKVTAIQIQLEHTAQMPTATARLEELLATNFKREPLVVLDYETLTPIYKQVIQFFNSMFGFISVLISVIVLFTVGNTMSTAVMERTTEIGTIRALGRRRSVIRNLFVCEGVMLGVIGTVAGVLVALPIAYLINHSGLTWAPPGYSYKYPVMVRVWGDLGLIFGCAGIIVVVSILSSWLPARRAAKLNIVDALRHV